MTEAAIPAIATGVSSLLAALRKSGLLAERDLDELLAWPAYQGQSLAERIFRAGVLTDAQLVEIYVSLGAVDATRDVLAGLPPPAALGAITRALAERHRALPLRVERARLVVALLDPSDTHAIEAITFFCGLAVEPRAVRPRVLFQALADAYGVPIPVPDGAFLARSPLVTTVGDDPGEALPAPSPDLAARAPFLAAPAPRAHALGPEPPRPPVDERVDRPAEAHAQRPEHDEAPSFGGASAERPGAPRRRVPGPASDWSHVADPSRSPLARVMARAGGFDMPVETAESALSLPNLNDDRPARTPVIAPEELARVRAALPLGSPVEARDSLPPQVLRLLVPPLRSAVLFLVRGGVAVGWDARSPSAQRDQIRDLLLPLTAPSVLERALAWQRVAVGNAADPTTTERLVFRALDPTPPSSFAAVPIVVGDTTAALLYIDRAAGMLDDTIVEAARQVGSTLADGLAPFVAAGALFPLPNPDALPPIKPA